MSAILRSWLNLMVTKELTEACNSFKSGHTPRHPFSERPDTCLSVRFNIGRQLQLIELHGIHEGGFKVNVSDGSSYIRAIFTETSVRTFAEFSGRGFPGINGGILVITDWSLNFRPEAIDSRRLWLTVYAFKLLGSEGSGTFNRPSDLSSNQSVQKLLKELEHLLSTCGKVVGDLVSSPTRSQQPNSSVHDSSTSTILSSQACFSTQVPEKRVEVESTAAQQLENSSWPDAQYHTLLGYLQNPALSNQEPTAKDQIEKDISSAQLPQALPGPLMKEPAQQVIEMSSTSGTEANVQPASSIPQATDPQNRYNCMFTIPNAHHGEKEINEENVNHDDVALVLPAPDPTQMRGHIEQGRIYAQKSFPDYLQSQSLFEGMKRVPRRFVRIPEEQRAILECDGAWFKPRRDGHALRACIPSNVRDYLTSFIERQSAFDSRDHLDQIATENSASDNSDDRGVEGSQAHTVQSYMSEEDEQSEHCGFHGTDKVNAVEAVSDQERSIGSMSYLTTQQSMDINKAQQETSDAGSWSCTPDRETEPVQHTINMERTEDSFNEISQQSSHEELHQQVLDNDEFCREINVTSDDSRRGQVSDLYDSKMVKSQLENGQVSMDFSSDSPEDDLELEIPYAIDNISRADTMSHTIQALPSTAIQNLDIVQVENSPNDKPSLDQKAFHWKQARNMKATKSQSDVSSDPVIPATFDKTSQSQDSSPKADSQKCVDTSPLLPQPTMVSDITDQTTNILDPPKQEPGLHEAEAFRHEHSIQDHTNSQDQQSKLANTMSPSSISAKDPFQNNPGSGLSNELSTYAHKRPNYYSPQLVQSSFREDPENETGNRVGAPQNIANVPILDASQKQARNQLGPTTQNKLSRRRRFKVPTVAIIEDDCGPTINNHKMIRASRHEFISTIYKRDQPLLSSVGSVASGLQVSRNKPASLIPTLYSVNSNAPNTTSMQLTTNFQGSTTPPAPENLVSVTEAQQQDVPAPTFANATSDETIPDRISPSREVWHKSPVSNTGSPHIPSQAHIDYFEQFKTMYPTYKGGKNRFAQTLVYIEWLRKGGQLLHRSLCDDFIRVNADEYRDYVKKENASSKRLLGGFEYYDTHITKTLYKQEVITPNSLQAAISSLDSAKIDEYRSHFAAPRSENAIKIADSTTLNTTTLDTASPHREVSQSKSRAKRLKRARFFETPSQLTEAKRRRLDTAAGSLEVPDTPSRSSGCKTARRLPWEDSIASEKASRRVSQPPVSIGSPSPLERNMSNARRSKEKELRSHSSIAGAREPSPILGEDEPFTGSIHQACTPTHNQSNSPTPYFHTQSEPPKTTILDARFEKRRSRLSHPMPLEDSRLPSSQELQKAAMEKSKSFADFVKQRFAKHGQSANSSSFLSSLGSSSGKKYFSIKPKNSQVPETQAWEYGE